MDQRLLGPIPDNTLLPAAISWGTLCAGTHFHRTAAQESGPSVRVMSVRPKGIIPTQHAALVQPTKQRRRCGGIICIENGLAPPHILSLRGRRARVDLATRCDAANAADATAKCSSNSLSRACASYNNRLLGALDNNFPWCTGTIARHKRRELASNVATKSRTCLNKKVTAQCTLCLTGATPHRLHD